ncbi:carbohydrate-binding protein [Paenactinomyces guangxiensis]|uniref:carbohydrate-binding protein n=1 Tax=Paenactinomyces guangxiensis TaxID=1490290 RepID=UPI001E45EFA4|nr:carbohydrate-binding protein [Paenactinomyces guangxiensis]
MSNGPYSVAESSASNGRKVGYIDYANSYVEFKVSVPSSGYYVIAARTGNGTSRGYWATHKLSVNGGTESNFHVANAGWNNWGTSTAKVWLNAGNNKIRFRKGDHYAEIDCLDVFLVQ